MNDLPITEEILQIFRAVKTSLQASPRIELSTFLGDLFWAVMLSVILGFVYVKLGRSLSNRREFASNFVLITAATMVVISLVKSSLALSLGLVGALSIVRFRTAIKEPEELAYLFVAIAIGLGYGANQGQITFAAFIFIVAFLWLRSLILRRSTNQNLNMLISAPSSLGITVEQVMDVLTEHCAAVQLRRLDQDSDKMEASFMVEFEGFESFQKSRQALHALNENLSISFLDNRGLS